MQSPGSFLGVETQYRGYSWAIRALSGDLHRGSGSGVSKQKMYAAQNRVGLSLTPEHSTTKTKDRQDIVILQLSRGQGVEDCNAQLSVVRLWTASCFMT